MTLLEQLFPKRGRPDLETSDRNAREAQFLTGKPVVGVYGQSAQTILKAPRHFQWWWEAVIDWMLANPHRTMAECAKDLNCTKEYVYQLTKSDLFLERYRERVRMKNELLTDRLVTNVTETAFTAVGMMQETLDHDRQKPVAERKVDLETLSNLSEKLLKGLGYGGGRQGGVNIQVNQSHVETGADPAALAVAASRASGRAPGRASGAWPSDERSTPFIEHDKHDNPSPSTPSKAGGDDHQIAAAFALTRDADAEVVLVAGPELDPELLQRELEEDGAAVGGPWE